MIHCFDYLETIKSIFNIKYLFIYCFCCRVLYILIPQISKIIQFLPLFLNFMSFNHSEKSFLHSFSIHDSAVYYLKFSLKGLIKISMRLIFLQ